MGWGGKRPGFLHPAIDAPLHRFARAKHCVNLEEPGVFPHTERGGALALRYPLLLVPTHPMLKRRSLMNEASQWRHGLAQQLAAHYSANPKVTAVSLGGSVSQGFADRFSDIDLTIFWTASPTKKERREIIKRARGRRWELVPYNVEEGCWSEQFEVIGGGHHRCAAHDGRGHRTRLGGCAGAR